ncbi:MAG: MFS transporter [Pseudomonadota bacterium]
MNRQEVSTAVSIGTLYIIRMLGLFMVIPVLPLVVDLPGMTPVLLGLALGIYGLSQGILQIPLGRLSDRMGRKPVILAGLCVLLIGSVIAALAESAWGVVLGRLLQGCGAIASTLLALVSDHVRPEHRGKAMAIVGSCIGGSFGLALVAGPWIHASLGLSGVFSVTACLAVLGIAMVVFLLPQDVSPQGKVEQRTWKAIIVHRDLQRTTLSSLFLHFHLMSGFLVFPTMMVNQLSIDVGTYPVTLLMILAGSFIAALPLMMATDRWPGQRKNLLVFMIGVMGLSLAGMSVAWPSWWLLLMLGCFFMAFNLLEMMLPNLVAHFSPDSMRGAAMGLHTSAQFFGAFAGGAVGGWLIALSGEAGLLWANAGIALCWLFVVLWMTPPGHASSKRQSLDSVGTRHSSETV